MSLSGKLSSSGLTEAAANATYAPLFNMPMTIDPRLGQGSSADVGSVDRCAYQRISVGSATVNSIVVNVVTSSGNIGVALYSNNGSGADAAAPTTRQATSGATACPAVGRAEVSLGGSVKAEAGQWYALSADNTTAKFSSANGVSGLLNGLTAFELAAHPPPSSAASSPATGRIFYMLGAV